MKRIALFLVLLCAVFGNGTFAQSPALWAFYHATPRSETSMKFTIPGFLPKVSSLFIKEKETRRLVRKLGKVRLFIIDEGKTIISKEETNRLVKRLHNNGFYDFLSVKDKEDNVHFMLKEKRDKVRGVIMLVKSADDFVLISAKCRLSIDQIAQFINEHSDEILDKAKSKKKNTKNT